tara:strand:- start:5370 stop:5795 length:426 start_codon:yes stop_codon:yes gene_type:complete
MNKLSRYTYYLGLILIGSALSACGDTPIAQERQEVREVLQVVKERTLLGHDACIELIKSISRNPATTVVPEIYNIATSQGVTYKDTYIAVFEWTGFNMVQAQNGFGATIGVEATCEYNINVGQLYGLVFDGQIFIRNGVYQ